ncbi:DUF192 domain-containing protein [Candidatus Uhrbacteria bacterium]|nr:DUF192 domain-containing protein [Candidatus Uhrbacteria bacterium]
MLRASKWIATFAVFMVVSVGVVRFLDLRGTRAPVVSLPVMATVRIPGSAYDAHVEVARTPGERLRGLSGRPRLGDRQGMLFVFDGPDRHGIWMRDMRFSIDLIWVSGGVVVDTTERLPVPHRWSRRALPVFRPSVPALLVLEVPAGTVDRYRLNVGERVEVLFDEGVGQ